VWAQVRRKAAELGTAHS